jgi:hypothetical protein
VFGTFIALLRFSFDSTTTIWAFVACSRVNFTLRLYKDHAVRCLIRHRAMKAYGSGGITPLILNLDIRWGQMMSTP